ncbi:hypothetical protein [Agrobacterium tumefaciens]|uniref:hypothetical protein n=1 Tax=Agrobacterium tumefaciens TaxID=358 RepID=UPI001F30C523
MAGQVTSLNFSGAFSVLNGTVTLTVTHPDINRSLLTIGYPSRRSAARVVGLWREKMLFAMATGYLDLSLNAYFRNLEQTEKAAISFLFGEAFTHWYAQCPDEHRVSRACRRLDQLQLGYADDPSDPENRRDAAGAEIAAGFHRHSWSRATRF